MRDAAKSGHLKKLADGKFDAASVGTGWRRTNRNAEARAEEGADSAFSAPGAEEGGVLSAQLVEQTVERIVAGDGAHLDMAEAERRKAVALAKLRELEYDLKSGMVVPAAAVVDLVGAEYARVRTRLLAIPAEQAPRLHRLRTPAEVQDALREMIVEALEELARDGGGRPG